MIKIYTALTVILVYFTVGLFGAVYLEHRTQEQALKGFFHRTIVEFNQLEGSD